MDADVHLMLTNRRENVKITNKTQLSATNDPWVEFLQYYRQIKSQINIQDFVGSFINF